MRMLPWLMGVFTLMAQPIVSAAPVQEAPESLRNELVATTQKLMDALPTGDKAAWEQWVTDDAVIIDEFGRVAGKADTIASLHAFPTGITGSMEMRDPHAWLHGDSALLSVEQYEKETYFGQSFVVRYRALLTFVKQSAQWKVAGFEDVTIPSAPPRLDVPRLALADYTGTYRYAPGRAWTLTVDHGVLGIVAHAGGKPSALQPVARDVFMGTDDERNLFVFQRDDHGRVVALIERRKFNDLRLGRDH